MTFGTRVLEGSHRRDHGSESRATLPGAMRTRVLEEIERFLAEHLAPGEGAPENQAAASTPAG